MPFFEGLFKHPILLFKPWLLDSSKILSKFYYFTILNILHCYGPMCTISDRASTLNIWVVKSWIIIKYTMTFCLVIWLINSIGIYAFCWPSTIVQGTQLERWKLRGHRVVISFLEWPEHGQSMTHPETSIKSVTASLVEDNLDPQSWMGSACRLLVHFPLKAVQIDGPQINSVKQSFLSFFLP